MLGLAGASRCSAFVAIDALDFVVVAEGFAVTIRSDKTEQDGRGCTVEIPSSSSAEVCDVRSVLAWLNAADIPEGSIFRAVRPRAHRRAPRSHARGPTELGYALGKMTMPAEIVRVLVDVLTREEDFGVQLSIRIEGIVVEEHARSVRLVLADEDIRLVAFAPRDAVQRFRSARCCLPSRPIMRPIPPRACIARRRARREGAATRPPRVAPEASGVRCDGWIADDAVGFAYAPERFIVVGDASRADRSSLASGLLVPTNAKACFDARPGSAVPFSIAAPLPREAIFLCRRRS